MNSSDWTNPSADLAGAMAREWLETNGLGGFSSSTIIGLNTRRYHGLLTAATSPPVGRLVLLSKLEEVLIVDGRRYELSTNQYPGVIHPQGFQFQTGFRLDPFPVFTYEVQGLRLEKSVFMLHGRNSVVIQYELSDKLQFVAAAVGETTQPKSLHTIQLEIRPLIAFRDYHSTTHENGALNQSVTLEGGIASVRPYSDLPVLYFAHHAENIDTNGFWYRNFQYAIERERGLDFEEDLFSPFSMTFDLGQRQTAQIIASTERQLQYQERSNWPAESKTKSNYSLPRSRFAPGTVGQDYRDAEIDRRKQIAKPDVATNLVAALSPVTHQFIVNRANGKTVIAGYHWFSDWGRDTMIALPGLTLVTGRAEIAKSILSEFASYVDRGMLPNRFPDGGENPEYNTVDATLWFFEAVRSLLHYTHDYEFVRQNLYPTLTEIIEWHVKGTRYNIHVDDDGLLYSGEPGVQLTWMDAKVGDWVVTPRQGKPVEIQALWYNALRVMAHLADRFDEPESKVNFKKMATHARTSFNQIFWNRDSGCLYDVVDGKLRDSAIRPNQILAVSLLYSMVPKERGASILHVVERELLTSRGLRTLSPNDPHYIGRYEGDPHSRDAAYHQGTVWPWLMGPYITGYVKIFGKKAGRKFAADWLKNFEEHLDEACLGQVSEIFDGDAPHNPRGCVAQAWSVAELLRSLAEDIYQPATTSTVVRKPQMQTVVNS